jgi:Tol biopolymer transport system component
MNGKAVVIAMLLILSSTAALAETTTLLSRRSQKNPSNGRSGEPAASETGQFVAFRSSATNLDGERCDNGLSQIFVSDGNTGTIRCISLNSNGRQGDQDSFAPSITGDGRFIAFTSKATNLAGMSATTDLTKSMFVTERAERRDAFRLIPTATRPIGIAMLLRSQPTER